MAPQHTQSAARSLGPVTGGQVGSRTLALGALRCCLLCAALCGLPSRISTSQTGKGNPETERLRQGWRVPEPTLSQSSLSRSTSILMSSGMAKEGWVSFSWMATCGEGVGSQAGIQTKAMVAVLCPFRAPSTWFQAELGVAALVGAAAGRRGREVPGLGARRLRIPNRPPSHTPPAPTSSSTT